MDEMKVEVASPNEAVIVTCPKCHHKTTFVAAMLLRGMTTNCDGCGAQIRTFPASAKLDNSAILKVEGYGESVHLQVTQRVDGVWFFLDDDEAEILKTLDHDSDRAVALIVGSMIDHRLKRALKVRMVNKDKETTDKLFRVSGPLGSFSARIDLAST
jgi:hypothetical protein